MDDVSGSADSDILLLISSTNPTSTNITAPAAPAAEDTRCHYGSLTGTFGILVQFLLALIAFSCLIGELAESFSCSQYIKLVMGQGSLVPTLLLEETSMQKIMAMTTTSISFPSISFT